MSLPSARGTGNDGVNGVKKTWYEIDPEKRVVMEDLCDLLSGRRRGDGEGTITPMLQSTLSPSNTAQKNFMLVYTSPDDKQVLAWGSGEIANDGFKSLTIHDRSVISRPAESLDHMMLQDMLRRGEKEELVMFFVLMAIATVTIKMLISPSHRTLTLRRKGFSRQINGFRNTVKSRTGRDGHGASSF